MHQGDSDSVSNAVAAPFKSKEIPQIGVEDTSYSVCRVYIFLTLIYLGMIEMSSTHKMVQKQTKAPHPVLLSMILDTSQSTTKRSI